MTLSRIIPEALRPDHLRRLGFFREFSPPEARRLVGSGVVRTYEDGELLATEGTRKQRRILYVVLQGKLAYVKRVRGERAEIMLTLLPGDVGGFLTFFNDEPSPLSVRSVGHSRVFEIGRREFQVLMADHPVLAVKILLSLLQAIIARLNTFLGEATATSAWVLELEQHLRKRPVTRGG